MYELQRPDTPEQWEAYHEIRRRVLWQARGRLGEYNAQHPDEFKAGNHPMLLMLNQQAIGVVRIDVEGSRAIFRRVAVREDVQRMGHGRELIRLAERFAQERGCRELYSYVNSDAVLFYERCGFRRDQLTQNTGQDVPMEKLL